jgi:hypothetical protein
MKSFIKNVARRIRDFLIYPLVKEGAHQAAGALLQLNLKFTYENMRLSGTKLPQLSETGFKAFSQTDEDGILLYIFSIIGTKNRKVVEICAGDGIECNAANLIINHGWTGLLVDGDEKLISHGKTFYANNRNTYIFPPTFVNAWVTRSNVNQIIYENGFAGEVDLLSIDMDGVDYWIWQAIDVTQPRVVVCEYQDIIGLEKSLTVPYNDNFNAYEYPVTRGAPNFAGASLPAFVKLARQKGYRLVGCNRYGYNAFFIKNPVGEKEIPEIPISECFTHPRVIRDMKERFPTVESLPWEEV